MAPETTPPPQRIYPPGPAPLVPGGAYSGVHAPHGPGMQGLSGHTAQLPPGSFQTIVPSGRPPLWLHIVVFALFVGFGFGIAAAIKLLF